MYEYTHLMHQGAEEGGKEEGESVTVEEGNG